eukprot:1332857-Amorphochlora_amoeboformis.AAC.1
MSTNHRIGNSDTTKDSGLAAHWAVASILLVAQAIATVYTQYNQHRLPTISGVTTRENWDGRNE